MAVLGSEIERLIQLLAKLPGLGPRSARRAALVLLKKRDTMLEPLAASLREAADAILTCETCGNLDTASPCAICSDGRRDPHLLCVVEDVADLWALERAGVFRGRYHVLGGALSALDGVTPDRLSVGKLMERASSIISTRARSARLSRHAARFRSGPWAFRSAPTPPFRSSRRGW
jgi:recombination protein RecR